MKNVLFAIFIVLIFGFAESQTNLESLKDIYVFDGHNDLPWRIRDMVGLKLDKYDFASNLTCDPVWGLKACKSCHTDLPRLRAGKVGAQFWSIYVSCSTNYKDAVEETIEQIELTYRLIAKYKNDLQIATSPKEIESAFNSGKIASLLGVEGGHSIDSRLSILRMYYALGVRYMTLTHSCNLPWADASPVDNDATLPRVGGLTHFGKKVVSEMNRLGMIVDLSHVSEEVMKQALDISNAPVMFSHSSCYALFAHHRNVKDEVIYRLRRNGGIIMINFYPSFLVPPEMNSTVETVVAHINHVVDLIGPDHVGLGGDFDGVERTTIGLEDVSKYQKIFKALHDDNPSRWTVENLEKLGNKNLIRVFTEVELIRDTMAGNKLDDSEIPIKDLIREDQIVNGQIKACRSGM